MISVVAEKEVYIQRVSLAKMNTTCSRFQFVIFKLNRLFYLHVLRLQESVQNAEYNYRRYKIVVNFSSSQDLLDMS